MTHAAILNDLRNLLKSSVCTNVSLAPLSTWKIGGAADVLVAPETIADVSCTVKYARDNQIPLVVIGDGSNVLFDDEGVRGIVLRIGRRLSRFQIKPDGEVWAEAGAWMPLFVRRVAQAGLQGCEHAIGVPGTLGGLVVMNGGTNRRGIGEQIIEVEHVTDKGDIQTLPAASCGFSYRHSVFQECGGVVVAVRFRYQKADPQALRKQMILTLMDRNRKFPRKLPNCGSVFLSDPALHAALGPPGKMIELAGMKGAQIGGAQVSPHHANFIVNKGGATSSDVLRLIAEVRRKVFECSHHWMSCEVRHIRPDGSLVPAHESAERLL